MRIGFIGSRPLHLVPPFFFLSPSHTSVSSLFFHVFPCFMSCHLISVLLLRAHGLALSMYMHNLLSTQVLGPPFLTMRWFVIGCPCALDSFSLQPHTPLSRLVASSRLRSFVLLLTVRANVCVSASRLLFPRRFVTVLQGGSDPFSRHCLTKTLLHGAYIIAPLYIYIYI